jgi:hypothetical protein
MAKKIVIGEVIINAYPPHQYYLSSLIVTATAAKKIGIGAISFSYTPPIVVNIGSLLVDVINEKFVHLEDLSIDIITEKNSSINALTLQLFAPKQTSLSTIIIENRMLRSMEISALDVTLTMLPTRTRFHNVNIQALKLPHKSLGALDIAFGFPYKVITKSIPLTTFWGLNLQTEVSGSMDIYRKIKMTNIRTVYESTVEYYGNDLSTRVNNNIRTAIGITHKMKTDIYLDYSNWITRKEWIPINIITAATLTVQQANHIFVLGGTTKKYNTSVIGQRGLYIDNLKVSSNSLGYADLGLKKIWLRQQTMVGYSEFLHQVSYGFFVKIPNNIATYNVDKSWIGIPLLGVNLLDLDVQINLLDLNTIDFSMFTTPTEILNVYSVLTGSIGTIQHHQNLGYIEITELTKRHQELYTGGDMVLQVIPSNRLIYEESLLQRPFLYRVFNINMDGNFIYKIFNEEELL